MNKTARFVVMSAWLLSSRGYDAYSTYCYTPDLSHEANPLVSVAGLTWTPLLLIVGGLTLYTVYTYYIRLFRPIELFPAEKGFSFSNFSAYIYLGKKLHWTAGFYTLPNSWTRFNHYMGITLVGCLAFAGIVSTIMWLLIQYTDFYLKIHSATAIYLILVLGSCGVIFYQHLRLYRLYKAL